MAYVSFQNGIDFVGIEPYNNLRLLISPGIGLPFQINAVDGNSPEVSVSLNTFHAVIADFFGIKIAAVAFSASDTLPVV